MKKRKVHLYVKEHNVTGAKYFGGTTKDDPVSYEGSGVKWRKHLEENGNDVSTTIIGTYADIPEARKTAINFSINNKIVESNDWMNCREEYLEFIDDNGKTAYDLSTDSQKKALRDAGKKGGRKTVEEKKGWHGLSPEERKRNNAKGQETVRDKYGVDSYFSIINKDKEMNEKKKKIFKEIKHQQGHRNSNYGKCWIKNTKLQLNKKICKEDIDHYLLSGWERGRKMGWGSDKS